MVDPGAGNPFSMPTSASRARYDAKHFHGPAGLPARCSSADLVGLLWIDCILHFSFSAQHPSCRGGPKASGRLKTADGKGRLEPLFVR